MVSRLSSIIVFIGGQSQSSKTPLGKQLAKALGFTYTALDFCTPKDKTLNIGEYSARGMKFERLQSLASDIISDSNENTVIEGGWIIPEEIEALSAKVKAKGNSLVSSFLGYPDSTVKSRKVFLKGKSNTHHKQGWRTNKTLHNWIGFSKEQQTSCARLDIPYFNFSDTDKLDKLQADALADIFAMVQPKAP
jgi:2-phosphoglycerate kinase